MFSFLLTPVITVFIFHLVRLDRVGHPLCVYILHYKLGSNYTLNKENCLDLKRYRHIEFWIFFVCVKSVSFSLRNVRNNYKVETLVICTCTLISQCGNWTLIYARWTWAVTSKRTTVHIHITHSHSAYHVLLSHITALHSPSLTALPAPLLPPPPPFLAFDPYTLVSFEGTLTTNIVYLSYISDYCMNYYPFSRRL